MERLVLQKVERPHSAVSVTRSTRAHDLRHVSILLIDDDPQAQALIEMALLDAHFERKIDVIATAAAGLERVKAGGHDIYLVDQRLPDGTGLDLIRAAKDLNVDKPFILMTGYGSGALDEAALREGAADRGAALTRQLLSFSRKQFLNPTVINVNESVAGLLHMLPRLIGDHIQTEAHLGTGLGFVKADASQVEQVIVNLVLNARDAMPGGGHITIETGNVKLD